MQVKFAADNAEVVEMIKSVDLSKIFGIINFGPKDKERKQAVVDAINMLNIYAENHHNHEGKFLAPVKPIIHSDKPKLKKKRKSIPA